MDMKNGKREGFSSGLAVFFATLGSAVGLGNIWKFPYVTGANGGGAFLLIYLLCIFLVGLPVMISEFYIGRTTRKNAVGAFETLKPGKPWKVIGYMGMLSSFLIVFFYSAVAGWVYSYVVKALTGQFRHITADTAGKVFGKTIVGPWPPILWQVVVIVVVSIILIAGVKKGIEKITKTLMPVLFVLIVVCAVRAVTLKGGWEGIQFLFSVDFGKINASAILAALGLAFFKLSLGMGTMITYGSYFTQDNHLMSTAGKVALSDTLVSMLAGLAVFPAVFSFGLQPEGGPGLLFVTIPLVFSKIVFGDILLIAFFLLAAIAATTAMISMVEVPVAFLTEEKGMSRRKAVLLCSGIILAVGVLATLSSDKSSLLCSTKIFGKTFFDLFDFLSSNILLPLGGLLIVLFMGTSVKRDALEKELSNNGKIKNMHMLSFYYFVTRYITPALLVIIFLNSIGVLRWVTGWIKGLF